MAELDPLLVLAQRVAAEATALEIKTALIGAMALAHYGYPRATIDVDFACATQFDTKLQMLADRLRSRGFVVEARAPGDDDPVDGVLRIREREDSDPVDVINFKGTRSVGGRAVSRAIASADGFTYVGLPDLIALKLYAGSRFDQDDAARVLAENPDVSLEEVRSACAEAGLERELDELLRAVSGSDSG